MVNWRLTQTPYNIRTPVGAYDLLIASHALVLDLTLVTANPEGFGHVPGLSLETWR